MTRYLVGIDNGSQSSKVTIFDEDGVPVASGRCALRTPERPAPGRVEYPDDYLWESIVVATRAALAAFDRDPADIAGVGLCTIRFCRALLTSDGRLARPVLSWMDERVGRPHEHSDDIARVTTSSGYITQRFTGEFVDTAANYQGVWPIDTDTRRWSDDPDAYVRCGMRREQLFDLVEPGSVVGRVTAEAAAHTGLPIGLPVVATANDKAVEALGCGLDAPDTLLISLGTYIAGMTVGAQNRRDPKAFWSNSASTPGRYLYESAGIRRGMWTISWFRDLLGEAVALDSAARGRSVEEDLGDEAARVPPGSDGLLTVLDWLASPDAPARRGTLLGFDARHTRGHVFRSLFEGIALTMRRHADAMAAELGTPFERVVLSGGGSRSALASQIVADVFGLPTEAASISDGAGLGAAICASVGLGVHPSFDAARRRMVHAGTAYLPDASRTALYAELGAIHRDIAPAPDPLYERLAAVGV